mmetsp:Transcript_15215/g.20125  ORF Transcript_15215/g.20125 Transcript_15215/m.20125 type:complete len:214 (-) Transcript_15215:3399-4040(-)
MMNALREREAQIVLRPIQKCISYEKASGIVRLSKVCTRKSAYVILTIILALVLPRARYAEIVISFLVSRKLNDYLKETIKQPRPYVSFPHLVKYFGKRKLSYSFPSQSVQTLSLAVWIFRQLSLQEENFFISLIAFCCMGYFIAATFLVASVRMYRGLHYPHDIFSSILLARSIIFLIPLLLNKLSVPQRDTITVLVTCFSPHSSAGGTKGTN